MVFIQSKIRIQRNIKNFGGNPNQVTIAGQSAGAMSILAHLISPNSKNLFHRAIIESCNYLKVI
jgi:para-nitrobenzyl esterase